MAQERELKRSMKSRHIMMISIGGTIGTGLFLGAGATIGAAGPLGAIIAFAFGGLVMFLVLLSLAEMAVKEPVTGSFYQYAVKYLSPGTGFVCGWMYWLNWALAATAGFTAAGIIMNSFLPAVPVWVWCALFAVLLAFINLISARAYGETEFWFAGIKVVAIICFVIVGALMIFGAVPSSSSIVGWGNFVSDGLFPNGFSAVILTMIAVVYSFQGAELIGIAAGECEHPGRNVPRVINGVGVRIVLFYILSVAVLAAIVPWKNAGVLESPFAVVFNMAGLPIAYSLMSFVVLTSALSANNGALYACSRLLWSMANEGMAPKIFAKLNQRGVPYMGMFLTLAVAGLSLLTQKYAAGTVYIWLMACTGISGSLVWIIISLCHFSFRRQLVKNGEKVSELEYRTPLYPLVPILSVVFNFIVIGALYFDSSQQMTLVAGLIAVMLLYVGFWAKEKFTK